MCDDCARERAAREAAEKARDDHFAVRLLAETERDMAKAEMERLMALVREWLDGNARLGRPKSVADQRFLNGLKVTG